MRNRLSKARVDTLERRQLVRSSIERMEKHSLPVTSGRVMGRLDKMSLTPVYVSPTNKITEMRTNECP